MSQRQFASTDTNLWLEKFGNGSDGAVALNTATDATANTSITALINATAATAGSGTGFANGNLILIHQTRNGGTGPGNWELNKIQSVGGGTNWTLAYSTIYAYDTTAQVYLLKQYSSVTINSGQSYDTAPWDGTKGGILAFLCNGPINYVGNSQSSTGGFRGGNTTNSGANGNGRQGEGSTAGGNTASTSKNTNGAGGGHGGDSGTDGNGGAGGGYGTAGGNTTGGLGSNEGGDALGIANLTTMLFGGGGGSRGAGRGALISDDSGGTGGNGAGIVLLIGKTVTMTGTINSNGGTGGNDGGDTKVGAGGGGGGGSVLIKAQNVVLGSNLITATGGAGGSGTHAGATGGIGRIHIDYLNSITGTTNPTFDSTQDFTLQDSSGMMGTEII